ncbi:MAG: bifunctional folylpolyglutamate synthase/dihydrofolate synthase [Bacteroidales bacterium]|nr:bifunctional folylpolyglutamate synthase/dihydrofolate synthase [Bacteroidales bacterium]
MTYEDTLDYIFSALPMYQRLGAVAYKADLENAYELDKLSGYPHRSFKTIHVAGTNGKGSVSHMLASVYQHAGYKVGLFTSPHLVDFRERIKINGELIAKDFIVKYIQRNKCFFEHIKPSFFEMSVFMAFCYFKINKVDVAIVETGLGGRLDTTNVVSPVLSVITNIGLDHTQFLGNNLKDIAKEKAGIIKPATPVVIGETHEITSKVFNARACLMESPVYYADEELEFSYATRTINGSAIFNFFDKNGDYDLECDLPAIYQNKNIRTCLKALEIALPKLSVKPEDIIMGLKTVRKTTGLMGRWHETGNNPLVICDVAHNKDGVLQVVAQLKNTPYKQLRMVMGFVNDKDIAGILSLLPRDAVYYFARSSVPRSADPKEVHKMATIAGLHGSVFQNVPDAVNEALNDSEKEDLVFIGGSTFVVADFLSQKN